MDDIKNSLKILTEVKDHRIAVEKFALQKYKEMFPIGPKTDGTYHYYLNFEIISESKIRINYCYGYAEMEYTGNFEVDVK